MYILLLLFYLTIFLHVTGESGYDNPEQDSPASRVSSLEELQKKWDFEV
jgi:hypothetical protein